MQINISWGTGAAAAPGAFQTAVRAACDYWCSVLTNPVTVNLKFDWAGLGAGGLAQTMFGYITAPYGTVRNALVANATTPDGVIAAAALPGSSPFSSPSVALSNAQARMLGLSAGTTDGTITLGSNVAWTFDPNNRAVGGAQDAIGALEHEISEALGRYAGFDTSLGAAGTPAVLNFFRRNAAGGIDASQTFQNDYFSLDGVHLLAPMGEAGGDWADWGAGVYGDSFGYGYTGMASLVTAVDLQSMSAIGWKVAANAAQTITNNGGLFHATGAQVQMQARLYGTLQGDANQINMGAGAILTINGASNSVAAAANAVVALAGGGNSVAAASGVQVQAGGNGAGGASNVVSGSGVSATLAAGGRMDVIGANNTVSAGAGANFGVWGGGNRVTASAGDGVWTGGNGVGGVSNTILGAGVSITLSANSRMDVYGAGNVISAGANAISASWGLATRSRSRPATRCGSAATASAACRTGCGLGRFDQSARQCAHGCVGLQQHDFRGRGIDSRRAGRGQSHHGGGGRRRVDRRQRRRRRVERRHRLRRRGDAMRRLADGFAGRGRRGVDRRWVHDRHLGHGPHRHRRRGGWRLAVGLEPYAHRGLQRFRL